MKQLKIKIIGKNKSGLLLILDKVKRKVKRGYFAGCGGNNTSGYKFDIKEVRP